MTAHLLLTRLHRPIARANHVQRPLLTRRLQTGLGYLSKEVLNWQPTAVAQFDYTNEYIVHMIKLIPTLAYFHKPAAIIREHLLFATAF